MRLLKYRKLRLVVFAVFASCLFVSCKKGTGSGLPEPFASLLEKQTGLSNVKQAVLVMPAKSGGQIEKAQVSILMVQKTADSWERAGSQIDGMAGKNGIAAEGEKKEGDGKTPSGMFLLSSAFGYSSAADTKLPYRQSAENDLWVDDPDSPYYNQWVSNDVGAKSYEKMRRKDHLYQYGIIVDYNTRPIVPGAGSAIFFHVWRAQGKPTSGCIAVSEKDILNLLHWLDPEKNPVVVIGKAEQGL